jgi:hypothetical protein
MSHIIPIYNSAYLSDAIEVIFWMKKLSRLFAKGPKTVLELTCFSLTATYKMLGN